MTELRFQPCQSVSPLVSELVELPPQILNRRSHSSLSVLEREFDDLDGDTSLLLPETPGKFSERRHQHVLVQGRLAFVRSVSIPGGGGSRSPASIVLGNGRGGGDDGQGATIAGGNSNGRSISNDGRASRYNMAVSPARATARNVLSPKGFESGVSGTALSRRARRRTYDEWFSEGDTDDGQYEIRGRSFRRRREIDGKRQFRGYGIGGAGNIRESVSAFSLPFIPLPFPFTVSSCLLQS